MVSTQQQLLERICCLEAENRSLAAAAEEAAQLAEEYASDASQWRSSGGLQQDSSLVNELTDAARRKDRRIQRLTSLLDAEKEKAEQLAARAAELEELKVLSDEMEETLQASVRTLRAKLEEDRPIHGRESPSPSRASTALCHELFLQAAQSPTARSILQALEMYFPEDSKVQGDMAAFTVLLRISSIRDIISYLFDKLGIRQQKGKASMSYVEELLGDVSDCIERALVWCFENPTEIQWRGLRIDKEIATLEERVVALFSEYESVEEAQHRRQDFAQMKIDLVVMSLESLNAVIPSLQAAADGENTAIPLDISSATASRAKEVAQHLGSCTRNGATRGNTGADVISKLNVTQALLSQRERELEDLRVRTKVFEERLNSTVEDSKLFDSLSKRIVKLESKLQGAKQALQVEQESKSNSEGDAGRIHGSRPAPAGKELSEVADRPYNDVYRRERQRLRSELVRTKLADLQPLPAPTTGKYAEIDKEIVLRDTITTTLKNAREAASNARAVLLDPMTLQPTTRGATLSRKGLLQALALARKQSFRKSLEPEGTSSVVSTEVHADDLSRDVPSLVRLLQGSL